MCGIAGYLGSDVTEELVRSMSDALIHRGPDDAGVWLDGTDGIALSHRRLSIVDLSTEGHQPMLSASGRYVISFNGEIYNHVELRAKLDQSSAGIVWRGHSDTETLLACFEVWGIRKTLDLTVGMFAIALWDRSERRLHLIRDRFGEKPLYYGWIGGGFVFGSELKALRRHPSFGNSIDRNVLALYLQFCYVPAPYSIYRDLYKLEPGCILSLSYEDAESPPSKALFSPVQRGTLSIEHFWSLEEVVRNGSSDPVTDDRDAVDQLENTLLESVLLQSKADVPLGAFLSGGIDSSTIVALMQVQSTQPVNTFSIGYDDASLNEAEYAKEVARHLGTDHTEMYVSPQQALDAIQLLPELYCEPFADSSQIPTYLVSQMARQRVTVALSGDAGDELFCGYNRYLWGRRIWNKLNWMPPYSRRMLGGLIQNVSTTTWDKVGGNLFSKLRIARLGQKAHKLGYRLKTVNGIDDLYRSLVSEWSPESGVVLGARPLPTYLDNTEAVKGILEPEHRMMFWDSLTYLPDDILQKVDRAAMGVSLETRVPFLDHRVAELAWRIPLNMKIRNGESKWVLRQVLYRHVPRELIERPKAGFAIPVGEWLRGPLQNWAEELLSASRLQREGYFDFQTIRRKWTEHLNGQREHTASLWTVLMFQAWLEDNRN